MTKDKQVAIFGTELGLMLAGNKPMAAFYRAVHETFDETGGQPFNKYVAAGKIRRMHFFVTPDDRPFRIVYTVYTLPGEEWRAEVYKSLKKIGLNYWNSQLEAIEGMLLGYIE